MQKMKASEFCLRLREIAALNTRYAKGAYGCFATCGHLDFLRRLYPDWYTDNTYNRLEESGAYLFDCVCLIKTVLNGWCHDPVEQFGGASPGKSIADVGTEGIMKTPHVHSVSRDFSNIVRGAILHKQGHVAVYVGENSIVEATKRAGVDGVRVAPLDDSWASWGLLACVDYSTDAKIPVSGFYDPATGKLEIDMKKSLA